MNLKYLVMKNLILLICIIPVRLFSQVIPEGYILQYEQNFSAKISLNHLMPEGNGSFSISRSGSNYFLQMENTVEDSAVTDPFLVIFKDYIFGDFIMEFDVMLPQGADTTGGLFAFCSYRDPENYYYINLVSTWFDDAGGVYIKYRSENGVLLKDSMNTWKLSEQKWTHFRLERNITARSLKFFVSDMKNSVIQVSDPRLVMGKIGFGSYGGIFYIDNIKIWAPTFIPGE